MIRIAHLAVVREFSAGQRNQIAYEASALQEHPEVVWDTFAYHSAAPSAAPDIRQIPALFRARFLRGFFCWGLCIRLSRRYDYVLMRHQTFDPAGLIMAGFTRNRGSIHHAMEIEELRLIRNDWRGKLASALERITGAWVVRRSCLIVGVTREIASYQKRVRRASAPLAVLPNGIDASKVPVASDNRHVGEIHIAFVCGKFMPWHGLDVLVDLVAKGGDACDRSIKIHLIGQLSKTQYAHVVNSPATRGIFKVNGPLHGDHLTVALSRCDVGIGSLAMYRQNLTEGATLKVRELLAMGIPVYSGHRDVALPNGFAYYREDQKLELDNLVKFSLEMKQVSRKSVRAAALPYIEKGGHMLKVARILSEKSIRDRL